MQKFYSCKSVTTCAKVTLCYKLTLRSNLTPTPTYYNRKSTETYRRRFCWRMSDKCILTALLYSGLFVRKHNVGRTGLPYKDVCMRDLKKFSIGLEKWEEFSDYRIKWRSFINQLQRESEQRNGILFFFYFRVFLCLLYCLCFGVFVVLQFYEHATHGRVRLQVSH